jgi:hypothetical protein
MAGAAVACTKEKNVYQYELNEVKVGAQTAAKNKLKSDLEQVSVAYSDLFNQTIPGDVLNRLSNFYAGMGDKSAAMELLTRHAVNHPNAALPTAQEMRADPDKFVEETYKKFFIRSPGEYERRFWVEKIRKDPALTPQLVYYSFMTAKEYKFY